MGGEKWISQRVVPKISNTPKAIWGKIQKRGKKKKSRKQILTLPKHLQEAKVTAHINLLAS